MTRFEIFLLAIFCGCFIILFIHQIWRRLMGLDIEVKFKAADEIRDALKELVGEIKTLNKGLVDILDAITPPKPSVIRFYVMDESGKLRKADKMEVIKGEVSRKFVAKVMDKYGNEAELDGGLQVSVTDDALASATLGEDGKTIEFKSTGKKGSVKLQAHGDADLGEGVKDILGEVEFEVLASDAETIALEPVVEEPPAEEPPAEEPAE